MRLRRSLVFITEYYRTDPSAGHHSHEHYTLHTSTTHEHYTLQAVCETQTLSSVHNRVLQDRPFSWTPLTRALHTTHYTLLTTHYSHTHTLLTTHTTPHYHYTLLTTHTHPHYTLLNTPTTHTTTPHYTLHTPHYTLQPHYTLHTTHYTAVCCQIQLL